MKVLFLIKKVDNSGASKIIAWIANKTASEGATVKVLSFYKANVEQYLREDIEFESLNIVQSSSRLYRNTIQMFVLLRKIRECIKLFKPNIAITFLDSVGFLFLPYNKLALRKYNVRVIASERSDPYAYRKGLVWFKKFALNYADALVFQTTSARDFFSKNIGKKSVVIPNPVVLKDEVKNCIGDYRISAKERTNNVVSVGRLILKQKRQDVLIKAFDIVHKKHPEIKLTIFGDGEDRENIQKLIEAMKLKDCVELAGNIDEVEKNIYSAKAFVLSSDYEGIPNSLIEALSLGLPCVSTDCSPGGAKMLIQDGKNGFIVDKGDYIALANKLMEIIENEELADLFSKRAITIVDNFSEDKVFLLWKDLFCSLLEYRKC